MTARRVCIVGTGQLSTCPRLVKAADALAGSGLDVTVVTPIIGGWAKEWDAALAAGGRWKWRPVDCSRARPLRFVADASFAKASRGIASAMREHSKALPKGVLFRAFSRFHDAMTGEVLRVRPQAIYSFTSGGMSVGYSAARQLRVPFGCDLEDYYSGVSSSRRENMLAKLVESTVLPNAFFLSAGSDEIAQQYAHEIGVRCEVVNNTFTLTEDERRRRDPAEPLKLYWFSQTIGPGRGLEQGLAAAIRSGVPCRVTLRGVASADYAARLQAMTTESTSPVIVDIVPPGAPPAMVGLAAEHDIGLALEATEPLNRSLCLTNKIFVYLASGLAILASDTPAQARVVASIGEPGDRTYALDDVDGMAQRLRYWWDFPDALQESRSRSRAAAIERWNWNHPLECGRFVKTFRERLSAA